MYVIAILGISVASSDLLNTFQPTPYDCQHRVYPWLLTKEACAGPVINCTKAGILGQSTEITTALLVFDESTLSSLTFTECPALEFPRTVQLFKGLTVLNVYNSAIVEWSADFALTGSLFPLIQTVRLWYNDLQCSPDGFYKYQLSPSLEWISFYDIDVTGFIHEVGDYWVNLKFLYFDMTRIEDIPESVTVMTRLRELSLTYNPLTTLNSSRVANLNQLTSIWST